MSKVTEITYTFSKDSIVEILMNDAEIEQNFSNTIEAYVAIEGDADDKTFYVSIDQIKEIRLVVKPVVKPKSISW